MRKKSTESVEAQAPENNYLQWRFDVVCLSDRTLLAVLVPPTSLAVLVPPTSTYLHCIRCSQPPVEDDKGIDQLRQIGPENVDTLQVLRQGKLFVRESGFGIFIIVRIQGAEHPIPDGENDAEVHFMMSSFEGMVNAMRLRRDQDIFQNAKICFQVGMIALLIRRQDHCQPKVRRSIKTKNKHRNKNQQIRNDGFKYMYPVVGEGI